MKQIRATLFPGLGALTVAAIVAYSLPLWGGASILVTVAALLVLRV